LEFLSIFGDGTCVVVVDAVAVLAQEGGVLRFLGGVLLLVVRLLLLHVLVEHFLLVCSREHFVVVQHSFN